MSPVGKVEIVAENRLTGFLKRPRNKVMGNVPEGSPMLLPVQYS